jgi:FAD/FMN-containing dehydrogenase
VPRQRSTSPGARALEPTGTLEPHLEGSAYVNHLAEDDRPQKVRASFGENYGRLRQLKSVYDPTTLFRINANIAPAG